jgi:hypothetical protein
VDQPAKTAKKDLDDATKQKVKTIMDDTKKQLEELAGMPTPPMIPNDKAPAIAK